jgi:hypothetical protein
MKAAADHLLARGYTYVGDRAPFADSAVNWKSLQRIECTCERLPHAARCAAKPVLEP